jgi:hypothetical protein
MRELSREYSMNIIFCAYRDWAVKVLTTIEKHPRVNNVVHVKDNETLYEILRSPSRRDWDIVLFAGWSSPPDEWATKEIPMLSEHPATSDRYSPGTPIQNQILDGISATKHRLVKVGYPELSERKWSHEVDMDLSGNMDDILFQMECTSRVLFNRFLDDYPGISWNVWDELPESDQVPRRVPIQSKMQKEDFTRMSAREIYDLIRCLEDPYPNAYIEDESGKLYFKRVSFKENG